MKSGKVFFFSPIISKTTFGLVGKLELKIGTVEHLKDDEHQKSAKKTDTPSQKNMNK